MKADSNAGGVYFECGQCGDCCSSWNIPIEGEKARILLEKPWVRERFAAIRRTFKPLGDDLYRIPLTDQNVCVFLADDRRCLVEANEGPSLKPRECRRFPFAAMKLPSVASGVSTTSGTVVYETSAACKKISETLLLAFRPILPKPPALESSESDVTPSLDERSFDVLSGLGSVEEEPLEMLETLPKRVPLGGARKTATWHAYAAWREYTRTVFMNPEALPEEALGKAYQSLGHLHRFPEKAMETLERDKALNMRLSRIVSSRTGRWLICLLLRKPYRTWSAIQLWRGRVYDDPRIFGASIDLRGQQAVFLESIARREASAGSERLLKAFLFNLLGRRLVLTQGRSLSSLLTMAACACLLVRWYAATLSWIRLAPPESATASISTDDMSSAIRLVERYYTGHQPRFLEFFANPWKSRLLEWILFSVASDGA